MPDSNEDVKFAVRFYETESGNEPDREWLRSQSLETKKAIGYDISLVQRGFPSDLPRDLVKHLGNGLFEVRTNLRDGIARVIFCQDESELIILNAFIKKTEKTSKREIDLALDRKRELGL